MAKKSSTEKNNLRDQAGPQHGRTRARLKAIALDRAAPPEERFAAQLKFAQMPRNGSETRVRNRCSLTGRPRGYYRKFKLSRIAVRELGVLRANPGHGQVELVGRVCLDGISLQPWPCWLSILLYRRRHLLRLPLATKAGRPL